MYLQLTAPFPPISDLSFSTLMLWWNLDNSLRVSMANSSLILFYNAPDDPINSGISLIGTNDVDETIKLIFTEQNKAMSPQRLVHVPDFVVENVKNPQRFMILEERDYAEYLFDVRTLYPLANVVEHSTRRKIKKFIAEAGGKEHISLRALDLSQSHDKQLIFQGYTEWHSRSVSISNHDWELDVITKSVEAADELGIQGLGLFIDGVPCGYVLYQISADGQCMILGHERVDYSIPYISTYMLHVCAEYAENRGIKTLNIEMDLGIPGLRFFKSHVGPYSLFRKYTIMPA